MAKSLALGYAMPDDASPSMFDPQTALALMAPGLVGPDGKVDVQGYQNQRMWQGLLGMASGLLSKSGPSTTPVGFGPALGAGLQGMTEAQQGYDKGALGGVSAAQAFANIGKLGAEEQMMKAQGNLLRDASQPLPPQYLSGSSTPAAIAGVPGNVDQVINSPGGSTTAAGGSLSDNFSDPRGVAPLIRAAAVRYGHDPDVAVKVAQSEGLGAFYGDGGKSGTAFQLYTGGGLGNQFQKETGLDPLDPKNEPVAIDWAMRNLSRTGWGPYHGAAKVGVGSRTGIDISTPGNLPAVPNFAGMMTGNQGVSYAPPTDMATGNAAPSPEPTVSILGPGGRFYNLTSAQADQFYRLDDGPPKQQFLANLSMTRAAPAPSIQLAQNGQISFPTNVIQNSRMMNLPSPVVQGQLNPAYAPALQNKMTQLSYAKIPVPQWMTDTWQMLPGNVKSPEYLARVKGAEETASAQAAYGRPEYNVPLQGQLTTAKTGAEEAARDPYLRGREQFSEEQKRITQGQQPQTIQPGGSVTYPPGSSGAAAYANAGRNSALPAGVTANPDGSVTVRGPSSNEEAFGKSLGELNAKNFMDRRQTALDAATSLDTTAEAKRLLNSGIVSGPFSDWKLKFDRVLGDNGIAANTEAFVATQGKQVGTIIKMFGSGTGLSNADREYAERIAGGKIDNLEEALRKIMDINERASRNVINKFNEDASQVPSGLSPYPLAVKMPTGTPPAEGAGRSGVTSSGIRWSIK